MITARTGPCGRLKSCWTPGPQPARSKSSICHSLSLGFMVTAIFNREDFKHPEDGFYCLEPAGTHPNREAGFALLIDPTACAAISTRFNTDAAAGKLSHGHEMLIDREHFKDRPDKETAADGWLRQTQSREDGLYGRIR